VKWKFVTGLFFVIILCLGSSGILVVQQQCTVSGLSTSHFFHYERSFVPNKETLGCDESLCCSSKLTESPVLKDNCCEINVHLFGGTVEYTVSEDRGCKMHLTAADIPLRTIEGLRLLEQDYNFCNHPPPWVSVLGVQQRLALLQQYLI